MCLDRIAPLKASLLGRPAELSIVRLVTEWTDYEFELYSTRQGRHDLELTLRLTGDIDVDPQLKTGLNCSETIFIDALSSVKPELDALDLKVAWTLSSSCVYAAIGTSEALHETMNGRGWKAFRESAKSYVVRGLSE